MKIIVKKPGFEAEVCEANGISEINKMVGNVDESNNGYDYVSSDIRTDIGNGVDMYMKENALYNADLEKNIWTADDCGLICGTIVFAGYLNNKICSLTNEQIDYCLNFIVKQRA